MIRQSEHSSAVITCTLSLEVEVLIHHPYKCCTKNTPSQEDGWKSDSHTKVSFFNAKPSLMKCLFFSKVTSAMNQDFKMLPFVLFTIQYYITDQKRKKKTESPKIMKYSPNCN